MKGTRESLQAKIGQIIQTGCVRRRILQTLLPLFLTLPRRCNISQLKRWCCYNEGTLHNWLKRDLDLITYNTALISQSGSGRHVVLFDPSYLPKSGKHTPGLGYHWSGQAGAVKRGIEIGCFAVGDFEHHAAFHLDAALTPSGAELSAQGSTLIGHYVSLVKRNKSFIELFGGVLVCDGYFGVATFIQPVVALGLTVVSCLKSNAALYYLPDVVSGVKKQGRPRVKGEKIRWNEVDNKKLPLVRQDSEERVRAGEVYVKSLKRTVHLVAVEYLREDGSVKCRKLYLCTDTGRDWEWILEAYHLRFQIEFLFRDAKQFAGLTHCQSTDKTKLENHVNLSLTAVSTARAVHWLEEAEKGAFSMTTIKTYYHNLALLEQFSVALGLDPTRTKNNPKIQNILKSNIYIKNAA
jgi:Transposase DDE domain